MISCFSLVALVKSTCCYFAIDSLNPKRISMAADAFDFKSLESYKYSMNLQCIECANQNRQSSLYFAIIFIISVIFSMTKRSSTDLGHSNRASSFKSWLLSFFSSLCVCLCVCCFFFNFSRLITIFLCLFCVYLHLLRTSQKIAQNVSDMRAKDERLPSHTWLNRHTHTHGFRIFLSYSFFHRGIAVTGPSSTLYLCLFQANWSASLQCIALKQNHIQ